MSSHLKIRPIGLVNWVGLKTLIVREINRFITVSLQTLVAPVVTTVLFYTIFALAFGGEGRMMGDMPFLTFLAPGLVVMSMVQNAFTNTSSSLIIGKIQKNIVDLLMPPLSGLELLIGLILGGIIRGLMIGIIATIALSFIAPMAFDNLLISVGFAILGTTC
jgi:ABC-2 type transport system permease protein